MHSFATLDSKPSSMWYTQHCFDLHRKKIADIKTRPAQLPRGELHKSHSTPRIPSIRVAEIQRENEILLKKIVDINSGKVTSSLSLSVMRSSDESLLPESLNELYRKREHERILGENRALMLRLLTEKPALSVKRLEADFQRQKGYREPHSIASARLKATLKKKKAKAKGEKATTEAEKPAEKTEEKAAE